VDWLIDAQSPLKKSPRFSGERLLTSLIVEKTWISSFPQNVPEFPGKLILILEVNFSLTISTLSTDVPTQFSFNDSA
jgi:hypothetical protein